MAALLALAVPAAAQNVDSAPAPQTGANQAPPPMGTASPLLPGLGGGGKVYLVNGNIITGFGNGAGGANTSVIETGSTIFGYLQNNATPARLADDYTIPTGQSWDLKTLRWTGYQTGAPTTGTMTGLFIEIFCGGAPGLTGVVCAGHTTTNRLTSQTFSGVYRVTSTTLTNTQRAILMLHANLGSFTAPGQSAGTYWLGVSATGSLASGPWGPITTPAKPTDNARQFFNAAWTQLTEPGFVGHDIYYEMSYKPTPSSVCATYCTSSTTSIAGCSASISCSGTPSLSAPGSYSVTAGPGPGGGNLGILYISKTWGGTIPLGTGFVCASPPTFRSPPKGGGGTAGVCNGSWNFTLSDIQASSVGLVANDQAWLGCWFRDPPGFGLSNGLSFVAVP
jgi:hypothetical protein